MVFILITTTASVAVYLAISLRFLGSIVSNDGLLNHILFITKGKKIILRVEGANALHQMIIAEEDGFIPIIIGACLLTYFLSVLCSRLVNGFIYYNLIHTLIIFSVYRHHALCHHQ